MMKSGVIKKWQYATLAFGVTVCLTGALLMWDGSALGENTTGIATVIGIIGIGIIGMGTTIGIGLMVNQEKRGMNNGGRER